MGIPVPAPIPTRPIVMKNSILKEKFKSTNFVKPLYRVKFSKIKPFTNIDKANLVGDVFSVNVSAKTYSNVKFKDTQTNRLLPGGYEENYDLKCDITDSFKNMLSDKATGVSQDNGNKSVSNKPNDPAKKKNGKKNLVALKKSVLMEPVVYPPETWLRVYPARVVPGESAAAVIFRCVTCQLGLTAILVLWTFIWVFIIQAFEGPHEIAITENFIEEQNQLVIDLATELRQITPISPKWREAIIKRIEEGRRQTMIAAGRGAKLDPGLYWDLSGTFLFTVYVMTALGFGAPVPQTVSGRCLSLLYAVIAVPTHVYVMMNASTCAVAQINHALERCMRNLRGPPEQRTSCNERTVSKDSPNCSVDSDGKLTWRRKKLCCVLSVLTWGHCVPLASVLYYALGVLIFGVTRQTEPVEIILFPIQFTTGGGLASVEGSFRILYGLYVEGAMALLSCLLATLRRYSGKSVNDMTVKYRLFACDKCGQSDSVEN